MALTDYTPTATFPDLDGTGGTGPLQLPQDNDPYLYDTHYISSSPKNGLFGKLINGLYFLKGQVNPSSMALDVGAGFSAAAGSWDFTVGTLDFWWEAIANAGASLSCALDIPHKAVVTSVSLALRGAQGHSAFPGGVPQFMPVLTLIKKTKLGVASTVGTVTDTSASAGVYEAAHLLTITGAPLVTIDRTTYSYHLMLAGEHGTNAVVGGSNGIRVYHPSAVWT